MPQEQTIYPSEAWDGQLEAILVEN